MRESAVHATWPRSVSRRSWSFSPINSVVPRSRSPLPQAVRDAERRTGEPGVALLAGVRGENSPHYTKRPPERKNANRKCRGWLHFRYSHDGLIQAALHALKIVMQYWVTAREREEVKRDR